MQPSQPEDFESLPNFRDLGKAFGLRPGVIFRSSRLSMGSAQDIQQLQEVYGIHTVVDMRDSTERASGDAQGEANVAAVFTPVEFDDFCVVRSPQNSAAGDSDDRAELSGTCKQRRGTCEESSSVRDAGLLVSRGVAAAGACMFRVPLASRQHVRSLILSRSTCGQKLGFVCLNYVLCQTKRALAIMLGVLDKEVGLVGLYKCFIDKCHVELRSVLQVVADPMSGPVVWHCTHGKDRTGIVSMMVLSVAGVDRESILNDYAITASFIPQDLLDELDKHALSGQWKQTPRHVMAELMDHIDQEYGGVEQYLTTIGFGLEWQAQLRARLVNDE